MSAETTDLQALIAQGWNPKDSRFRLTPNQLDQLARYLGLLNQWNRVHSLTAIEDPSDQVTRHILDALVIWPEIASRFPVCVKPPRVADVGSGMGVPGVVLAIVVPEFRIDLIERQQKKASFLRHAISRLGLAGRVRVLDQDVEKIHVDEGYDLIVCRAFSALHPFLAITQGISKPSTVWAAMVGKVESSEQTLNQIMNNFGTFQIEAVIPLTVMGLKAQRHLVWIRRAE